MIADNYHVVRKHPDGGYTYVQGFASDDDPDLSVSDRDPRFDMFDDALNAAVADYSEYGTTVHPEYREWADSMDKVWYREGIKAAREAVQDLEVCLAEWTWSTASSANRKAVAAIDKVLEDQR